MAGQDQDRRAGEGAKAGDEGDLVLETERHIKHDSREGVAREEHARLVPADRAADDVRP